VELQFYAALPLLVLLGTSHRNPFPAWAWLLLAGSLSYACSLALPALALSNPGLEKLLRITLAPHLVQFLLGMVVLPCLAWLGRRRTIVLLLGLALALLVLQRVPQAPLPLIHPLLWAALPLGIGLIPSRPLHLPDLSYGLYLFHMPLVNTFLLLGLSGAASRMPYLGGVFVLAAVSWRFVEQPALARKPTLIQASSHSPAT
jgi:peptidoglycan/LPS O-acetylase OafA/YrhL